MADYSTNASVVVSVNGQQAKKMLSELETKADDLRKKLEKAKLDGDTKEAQKVQKALNKINAEINQIRTATKTVGDVLKNLDSSSLKELNKAASSLKRQLRNLKPDDAGFKEKAEQLKQLNARIKEVNHSLREQQTSWQRFTSWINNAKTAILGIVGSLTGFIATAKKAVDIFAEMDQEMANVMKYTGMTTQEVEQLNEAFKKMDTRTSREDLNKLAQEAGRLGKTSIEDVLGFVRAADQINVALEDLGDGATLTLSKLTGIFGDEERLGTEKALLSVGSVINELAQSCAAGAGYLTEFASRLGGVGSQAGMTAQEIMSFGAVLDSNEASVEKSATAIQQLIVKMLQDPAKYAKAVGLEVKGFTELVKTDMNQALITFLEALNRAGKMSTLAGLFADMKEKGSGTVSTLATLAGNIEEVKNKQALANQAFEEAISITREFNVQNGTVQASLDKSKKTLHELMNDLGRKLVPVINLMNASARFSLQVLNEIVDFIKKYGVQIVYLTSIIVSYTTATKIANNWTKIWAGTTELFTVGIKKAAQEVKVFFLMLKANPVGMITAAITALVGALLLMRNRAKEAAKEMKELQQKQEEFRKSLIDINDKVEESSKKQLSTLERLYKAATNQANSTRAREQAARRLMDLYPDYFEKLGEEQIMLGNAKTSYDNLKNSILEVARAKAIEAKILENQGKAIDIELSNEFLNSELQNASANLAGAKMSYKAIEDAFNSRHSNYFSRTFGSTAAERNVLINARLDVERNEQLVSELEEKIKLNDQKLKDINNANDRLANSVNSSVKGSFDENDGNSGNGFGSRLTDKEAAKLAKAALKKAKDDFKKGLQDIKAEELKTFTELEANYSTGQLNYLDYIEGKRKAEEKFYDDSLKFYQENLKSIKGYNVEEDKDYQNLLLKKEETMKKYENQRISYSEDAIKRISKFEQQEIQERYRWKENKTVVDEMAMQEETLQVVIKYLKQRQDLYVKGTKEWEDLQLQIEKEVEDARYKKEVQYQNAVAELRKKFNKITVEEQFKLQRQVLEFLRQQGKLTVEEFKKMMDQLDIEEKKARTEEKNKLPGADYSRSSSEKAGLYQQDYDLKKKELDQALNDGKISLEEYERMLAKVREDSVAAWLEPLKNCGDEWVALLTNMGEAWYNFFNNLGEGDWGEKLSNALTATVAVMGAVMQQLTTFIQAEVDIQTAAIEKRYDAEIKKAEGNTYKVKKLEKQKEDEIAKVKNDANKKMYAMQVIQAVAQTATSALNAYSSAAAIPVVGWVMAPIAAAMAVAAGMMQVAAIKKQQQASEAQGYAEGGFTPAGGKYEPVGVVHAGEWVASQKLVNNPRTRPLIEALDYAQRNNTVGSISSADVSRSITAPMVLANGGASSQPEVIVNVPLNNNSDRELNDTLVRLNKRLDEPFVTINTVTGDYGSKKAQDDYDRLIKNKSPKSKK